MNERIEGAFNDQINEELFSSYVYLAMVAHFESKNLEGFANWISKTTPVSSEESPIKS